MRRPRSRLEGQTVELFAEGFEYPITGRINRIIEEYRYNNDAKFCYELETADGHIYLVDLDSVCWISTKKKKYRVLNVVDLHAIKK